MAGRTTTHLVRLLEPYAVNHQRRRLGRRLQSILILEGGGSLSGACSGRHWCRSLATAVATGGAAVAATAAARDEVVTTLGGVPISLLLQGVCFDHVRGIVVAKRDEGGRDRGDKAKNGWWCCYQSVASLFYCGGDSRGWLVGTSAGSRAQSPSFQPKEPHTPITSSADA